MSKKQAVSIIVPTLNEAGNIPSLLSRTNKSMQQADITYEVIIVDDHSSDGTFHIAQKLSSLYPVKTFLKGGERGKAQSLLEGFDKAKHDLVVMIDADLQYPPEEIVPMYKLMQDTDADIIVTNRVEKKVSFVRKISTKTFNLIFARLLFGINFDTQSGLKLFKKKILTRFEMVPSPWSFDMEFLVRSLENKFTIASHNIPFEERMYGVTKVKLLNVTYALAKASVQLRWRTSAPKIRAGYKANDRFLKKALTTSAFTILLGASVMFGNTATVNALDAPRFAAETPARSIMSILDPIKDFFDSSNDDETQPEPTSPAANTTEESMNNTRAAQQPEAQAMPQLSNDQATATTPDSFYTPPVQRSSIVDRSNLAPATGQGNNAATNDIYASGYPNYAFSQSTTDRLLNVARSAWLVGISLAGIAMVVLLAKLSTQSYRTKLGTQGQTFEKI